MIPNDAKGAFSIAQLREFDVICDRFERAWKAGGRPSIEEFLAGVTEPSRAELGRQLLEVEIEQRLAEGKGPITPKTHSMKPNGVLIQVEKWPGHDDWHYSEAV